ncbi:MAG: GWxTD domain-containing protein [Bacteroidales bacterium]|jgi:GWxTD domain-containing protein|nr:GWxTD domain-containing protein [Bacteroidales bacterium]
METVTGYFYMSALRRIYVGVFFTVTVIVAACLPSCMSYKPAVDTKDLSHMYNPTRAVLTPSYAVNTFSDESATLSVRFFANDLLFSEANQTGVPTAVLAIGIKIYKIIQDTRILADTMTYDLRIVKDTLKMEYAYDIPFKTEGNSQYVAEIKTLDRLRSAMSQTFVPFNTLSPFNSYNFLTRNYFTGARLFSHTLRLDEYINLYYARGHFDSLYISYFRPFEQIPDPPSMLLPQKQVDYEPERIAALAYSDTMPIMLPREGIYLCSVDRKIKDGYTLFNFGESYPTMATPEDMIDPLLYIATRDEVGRMKENPKPKIAIDDFWLKCAAGNIERARELIRIYYNRVVYSNIYFTSFTEGWRTERGMIYIMYGPPDKVYKSPEGDMWGYRKQVVKSSWGGRYSVADDYVFFTFKQRNSIFSDNDYFLSRSETQITSWDQAVSDWRKGVVFHFDNQSGN